MSLFGRFKKALKNTRQLLFWRMAQRWTPGESQSVAEALREQDRRYGEGPEGAAKDNRVERR